MMSYKKIINGKNYEVIICRAQKELTDFIELWDKLLVNSTQHSPMLSYAWVSSYLQHRLAPHESWYVLVALQNGELVGILPVIVKPNRILGLSRPIICTPNDGHTLGGDILVGNDAPEEVIDLLISAVERQTPDRYVIKLFRVVEGSPSIASTIVREKRLVLEERTGIGYYYPVVGEFDDYYNGLSKNIRGNLRRAENNLARLTKLDVRIFEGADASPAFLEKFMPVEASGWKGRSGSAIEKSAELRGFYTTLAERLSQSGMLRWECLYGDGELIAVNLSIRFGKIVVIWKLGYDEELKKYSPGGLLFKSVLERAFKDDDIEEFNLMSDTAWQKNWNPQHKNYFNLLLFPNKPVPFLFGYLPRKFKSQVRKLPLLLKLVRMLKKH